MISSWEHDDWERWGLGLIRERYGAEKVIDVPDGAGGDHGIEAYTVDGIAFQCYCAENEPLPPTKRGALQKKKIGADVRKFIDGGEDLQGILGATIIHTWVLLTPYHQDASVIGYCNDKAVEVMTAGLAYAAEPFRVTVHHLETYYAENQVLLRRMAMEQDLIRAPDDVLRGIDFTKSWSELIEIMDGKLAKLPMLADPERRAAHRGALLEEQLLGANLLDRWTDRVPDVASHMRHVLDTAKRQLILNSLADQTAFELYQAVRANVRAHVDSVSMLSAVNVDHITDMALADWLQECPLDFIGVDDDG